MVTEERNIAAAAPMVFRCCTKDCKRVQKGYPVVEYDGERRRIAAMRCDECAQAMLEAKCPRIVERWYSGEELP